MGEVALHALHRFYTELAVSLSIHVYEKVLLTIPKTVLALAAAGLNLLVVYICKRPVFCGFNVPITYRHKK